ncbi:hypothetical protein OWV82_007252 [Melia azedarach]|uniref:Uncharacterized protein n=1 Tax=Melia azedarach TaxID=155640 RepID=A0ACC1YJS9_MELAZ|nr:hypothetical protein OWV82_007252 [Melia azedarach]
MITGKYKRMKNAVTHYKGDKKELRKHIYAREKMAINVSVAIDIMVTFMTEVRKGKFSEERVRKDFQEYLEQTMKGQDNIDSEFFFLYFIF